MKTAVQKLQNCPLFRNITEENITALMGCLGAKILHYRKNETIFAEGDPARFIGIVSAGEVQILRIDYHGNRSIVGNVQPLQLFGEAFACAEVETLPISAVASEDSDILLIECKRLLHSCSNACDFHSRMIFNLLNIVARKNIMFNQRAQIVSNRTTRDKLLAYLDHQAKEQGNRKFRIPFDRQELADYLEVDRSGLSAEISKLRREGILESRKNEFELL